MLPRTLLRAQKEYAPRLLDRVREEASLADRERGWLLHVHVLAGKRGLDCDLGVPVVGSGDRDGVDVAARNQIVEVARALHGINGLLLVVASDRTAHVLEAARVEVARRHHARTARAQKTGRVHRAPDASASDLRDVDFAARRILAQHARRHDHRECPRRNCRLQKLSPLHCRLLFAA